MIGYLLRRFYHGILLGHLVCASPMCGRDTYGFTRYCPGHLHETIERLRQA